ncbi:MAG: CDP-alcohol phosphatidyltransferase family protein [Candidatus Desulfacyla sp.]
MNNTIAILISLVVSLSMYLGFVLGLKTQRGKRHLCEHWYYHPNAICVWRVVIGLSGILLYFRTEQQFLGILLFTLSAVMDGVDGLLARNCDLVTPFGEEIDPLCDKLTYLPPMLFFAYAGRLDLASVWILVAVETSGQFLFRYIIKRFTHFSVAANNFGKIKAVLCFALIIYCALLTDDIGLPKFANQILYLCIILSISSIVFKLIANRFYADILSLLNLCCGIIGIFYALQMRPVYAAIAILAGQIFDLFDGRMADKHGGTRFGPWLDDIADLVSFGGCPAFLILLKGDWSILAFGVGTAYFFAVAFRLWRFIARDKHDTTLSPGIFNGLPSPAGAMVSLGALLFWDNVWIVWAVILLTSYLLVSDIRFVHFGRVILRHFPRIFVVIFGFVVVFTISFLIKVKDPKMLGALLLLSFLIYTIMSIRLASRKSL